MPSFPLQVNGPRTSSSSSSSSPSTTTTSSSSLSASAALNHASWLPRYSAGEHVAVWDEIRAVGSLAHLGGGGDDDDDDGTGTGGASVRASAQAVSDALMRRVEHNLRLLAARLRARGWRSLTGAMVLAGGCGGRSAALSVLQGEFGAAAVPPAVRSFVRIVGSVDFSWDYNHPTPPPAWCPSLLVAFNELDPLYVDFDLLDDPAGAVDAWKRRLRDAEEEGREAERRFKLPFSSPRAEKLSTDVTPRAPYYLALPCAGADPVVHLDDGDSMPFVDYLRKCVRTAAFPDLEKHEVSGQVRELVAQLTEDFLDF